MSPPNAAAERLDIAIVSINYQPEPTGIAVYSTGMAEDFARRGHHVTVYSAFSYYPAWQKAAADQGRLYSRTEHQGVTLKRSYVYVPHRPTALRRILHEFSFTLSAALSYLLSRRHRLTVIVSPPLPLALTIGVLARLKRSTLVVHVQDLQPDAAVDLGMLRAGQLTRLLFAMERWTYRLAHRVSTISEAMRAKIEAKGVPHSKTLLFKNWADGDLSTTLAKQEALRAEWALSDRFVVLYAGNMGVKQGLGVILEAAERLKHDREIVFLIVGDGGEKPALVARAKQLGLVNVHFKLPVDKAMLGTLLGSADCSIITQKAGIQDLVLPSKLGNLLLSERPVVIAASAGSELYALVQRHACGVLVEPEDALQLAQAVSALKDDARRCAALAARGHAFARQHLSQEAILTQFLADLRALMSPLGPARSAREAALPEPSATPHSSEVPKP